MQASLYGTLYFDCYTKDVFSTTIRHASVEPHISRTTFFPHSTFRGKPNHIYIATVGESTSRAPVRSYLASEKDWCYREVQSRRIYRMVALVRNGDGPVVVQRPLPAVDGTVDLVFPERSSGGKKVKSLS